MTVRRGSADDVHRAELLHDAAILDGIFGRTTPTQGQQLTFQNAKLFDTADDVFDMFVDKVIHSRTVRFWRVPSL